MTEKRSLIFAVALLSTAALAYGGVSAVCDLTNDDRCLDSTCGVALPSTPSASCPCTKDDMGYYFSECDEKSGTRTVLHYWKPPAVCVQQPNLTLPAPYTIPCSAQCEVGKRLVQSGSEYSCEECEAGTATLEGSRHWGIWTSWPVQFTARCSQATGAACNKWRLQGTFVDSGSNPGSTRLSSYMGLNARISSTHNGLIEFRYRVSSEAGWDGLYFRLDGVQKFFASGESNWTVFRADLAAGYHTFEWEYYKDSSFDSGEDRAVISYIRVSGLTVADLSCAPCPAGYHQQYAGQYRCEPCPTNTYSDHIGAANCTDCPAGQASFAGSTGCYLKRQCTDIDMTWTATPCNATTATQTRTYAWIMPPACDSASATLPAPAVIACTPTSCKPGQQLAADGVTCEYCPENSVSTGQGVCTQCTLGQKGAARIARFDSWSTLPEGFTTDCSGACTSEGWRLGNQFIDSGAHHGASTMSSLSYTAIVESVTDGQLSFTTQLACDPTFSLVVYSGATPLLSQPCLGCDSATQTLTAQLSKGKHVLRWVYEKGAVLPANETDCDYVRIHSVSITGVKNGLGGSATCTDCPAGTKGVNDSSIGCVACDAGTTSKAGSLECASCPAGSFSKAGSPSCITCGTGTTSTLGSAECTFDCQALPLESFFTGSEANNTVFDLSFIGNRTLGFGRNNVKLNLCNEIICNVEDSTSQGHYCASYFNASTEEVTNWYGQLLSFNSYTTSPRDGLIARFTNIESGMCLADVTLLCDPVASEDGELTMSQTQASDCRTHYTLRALSACRKCTDSDYSSTVSACVNKQQNISYYWLTSMCHGGVMLPDTVTGTCEEQYSLKKLYLWIGLGVAGALVAGAAIIISVLVYKNRKIYAQYRHLQLSDAPMEATSS